MSQFTYSCLIMRRNANICLIIGHQEPVASWWYTHEIRFQSAANFGSISTRKPWYLEFEIFLIFHTKLSSSNYQYEWTTKNNSWINFFVQCIYTINVDHSYQIWLQSGHLIRRNESKFQASKLCPHPNLRCPPIVPPSIWPILAPFTIADDIFFYIRWNSVDLCPTTSNFKVFQQFVRKISVSE